MNLSNACISHNVGPAYEVLVDMVVSFLPSHSNARGFTASFGVLKEVFFNKAV
jgi:hypothetical protein